MGIDEGTTLEGIQNFAQQMWPSRSDQFWYLHTHAYNFLLLNQLFILRDHACSIHDFIIKSSIK